LLKPDFALLVSANATMYCNICSDILILKLVWFPGLKAEFQLSHLVEEISLLNYSSLLSQIDCLSCLQAIRFSEFVLFTTQFSSSGHSTTIVWVIHAFLLEHQSTRRCLVSICCFLNASARAALPVTRGFNFSPVALQQKRTLNLSLDSLPPLYLYPFLNPAFSWHMSIKQPHLICSKLTWQWVFICYLVQFSFPVFNQLHVYSCWLKREKSKVNVVLCTEQFKPCTGCLKICNTKPLCSFPGFCSKHWSINQDIHAMTF
jgi:hypothetical protein